MTHLSQIVFRGIHKHVYKTISQIWTSSLLQFKIENYSEIRCDIRNHSSHREWQLGLSLMPARAASVLFFSLAIHAITTKVENGFCAKLCYLSMVLYCVQVQYHNCHDGPYLPHQFLVFSCQVRMKIVKILLSVHFVIL